MTTQDTIDKLKKLSHEVNANYHAEILGIFGSYAREEYNQDSDIDIIVKFQERASLLDQSALSNFLRDKLGMKVDVLSENAIRNEIKESIQNNIIYL